MQLHVLSIYISDFMCVCVCLLALVTKSSQSVLGTHLLVRRTAVQIQVGLTVNELDQMGRQNQKKVPEIRPSELLLSCKGCDSGGIKV